MKVHQPRRAGSRLRGGLSIRGLAFALAVLTFSAANVLAGYVFTGGGTNTGTATGDGNTTTLYLAEYSGNVYHSTDGTVFSSDWGGGNAIPAASTTTINVAVSGGDGSVVQLGFVALSNASDIQAAVNVVCGLNTTDQIVIDDSGNPATVTYTVHTLPGTITAPGINFNQSASQAFQGGVTVKGGSGGDTFDVRSVCCAGATHEPLTLIGGTGSDVFNVGNAGTLTVNSALFVTDTGGGGSLVLDDSADSIGRTVTISSSQVTGASTGAINFGAGITSLAFSGGTGADTFAVTPSAAVALTVGGGDPTTCPGDSLTVDLTSVTNPVSTPGATGAGTITFGNRASITYTGIESLTPTTASVGGDQAICAGETTTGLGGNTPIFGTGMWSIVSGGTGTFNPNAAAPNATFTHATGTGPVILQWTISSPPCAASSSGLSVDINPTPPTPTAGNTGPYFVGQTISLTASTVAGATYSWTGPNGFTSADQNPTIPNATVAMSGTYSVTATVDGCVSAAGTTQVNVSPPIPTLSGLGLILLACALAACGALLLGKKALS